MPKTMEANMAKIALCEARGPLNDLNDKLSGEDGDQWLGALRRFLRKESPWSEVLTTADPDAWVDTFDLATIERRVFEITIDPTSTIEQMAQAGEHNYKHPAHTTAVFGSCRKITGTEPVKQKVVAFRIGRNATLKQANRLRARLNLQPICIQHQLALGAQHKNAQRDLGWIVNLDDVVLVGGDRGVSCLLGYPGHRGLDLHSAGGEWGGYAWFLGLLSE